MGLKYSDIHLQPLKSHKFKVIKPFTYNSEVISKGFVSDGASVPRLFWSIFPPNRTDYLPCAIIHDYICDKEEYTKADIYFCKCLKDLYVSKITRVLLLTAVRLYHKIKYKGYKWVKC